MGTIQSNNTNERENVAMKKVKQDYRDLVFSCIDYGYIADRNQSARDIILSEYGHARRRSSTSAEWMKDYLQGLPSICTVPFANYNIAKWLNIDPSSMDEDAYQDAIDQYWLNCGKALYWLIFGAGSK